MVLKILDNWAKLVTIVWCNQNLKNSSRPCGKIVLSIVKPIFYFSLANWLNLLPNPPHLFQRGHCVGTQRARANNMLGRWTQLLLQSGAPAAQLVEQGSHVFVLVAVTQGSGPTCGPCCLPHATPSVSGPFHVTPLSCPVNKATKATALQTKWAHILHY